MNKTLETKLFKITGGILMALLSLSFFHADVIAQTAWEVRPIIFPVIGAVTYGDDFGDPRSGGARQHEGNDLMGAKMMPLVAAIDGKLRVTYPEASWGYSVTIEDKDGYTYHYLHMNNDSIGTDDGKGGGMNAYAIDIDDGNAVVAGQLIGWMGDSGNAETTRAHLHFEIRRPDRTPISPYNSLKAATKITRAVPRPKLPNEILPFDSFEGGSFIAMGNVDADASAEIVMAAGPGGGPHVKITKQDGTPVGSFFPYAVGFRGGVDVAVADVNGDNVGEIITAPRSGGGPHVKIFSASGQELGGFMAYDPRFKGGINVSSVDINGDGTDEIITAPGRGGGPHVRVFNMNGVEQAAFFAYDTSFTAGIDVAGYSADLGQNAFIVTAPNTGGGPHVKIFNETGTLISQFMAYDPAHLGGVRVSLGQINSSEQPEIITVPLLGGSHIRLFDLWGSNLDNDWGFEEWWPGSWDVATYGGETFISSGPNTKRRASVRESNID